MKKTGKKKHTARNIILGFFAFFVLLGIIAPKNNTDKDSENSTNVSSNSDTSQNDPVVINSFDTNEYLFLDDDVLYEYGDYLIGEKVATVITIKSISGSTLKADTAGNETLFYSSNCDFDSKNDLIGLEEGGLVTIAGTVKDGVASTAVLENCTLIGLGEIQEELQIGADEQRIVCESRLSKVSGKTLDLPGFLL